MKTALAVMVVLIACLLAVDGFAQSTSRFQSVGGDFGRSVIGTLQANDTQPAAVSSNNSNSSLWNWGNAPKGSLIQNGKIVADPFNTWKSLNYTDAQTGEPVKTYVDPISGQSYYTYTDSKTGRLIYVYFNPETGAPTYASFTPVSGQYLEPNQFTLPPIFGSNDPWS